jgi:hypothetical protein
MTAGRVAAALPLVLMLVAAACVNEAVAPEDQPTFSASPSATARPQTPLAPSPPTLGNGVKQIGANRVSFAMSPGQAHQLDPYQFELLPGQERPVCAGFVFAFSWLVLDPDSQEPVDTEIAWTFTRQEGSEEVARGTSGSATVGCGSLSPLNPGSKDVAVVMDYLIGSVEE